jgi:DNA-binding response OmpR family regulator
MGPFVNSEVVPLSEVPTPEFTDDHRRHDDRSVKSPIVLVVDDEPLVADTLATILSRAGYMAVKAYGGLSALELAHSIRPALLISDVAMPEMNGVELAMAVLKKSPDCGILLFSGHATERDLAPAREAGHDFTLLSKPIHPREMLKHVSQSLHSAGHSKTTLEHLHPSIAPATLAESA